MKSTKQTVKETIDMVYEILSANPEGYELHARKMGFNAARCCSILVKRGIISKHYKIVNGNRLCIYKWEATIPPSKVLYGSVTEELMADQKNRRIRCSAQKKERDVKTETPTPENPTYTPINLSMDCFTDQELWDELKRRGGTIKDGKMMIVKAVELL